MKGIISKDNSVITYASFSEKGTRSVNEDAIAVERVNDNFCFVVTDGLGGHGRGEVASRMAAEQTIKYFKKSGMRENFISLTFEMCQKELLRKQEQLHAANEMKTTMVLCTICNGVLKWGHIGDSRLYIFKGGRLMQRSLDHSVPQMLVTAREIKEKEIRFHPDRNRLLKVMGTPWSRPEYELGGNIRITARTSILMCTDGFWELIDERAMTKCLRKAATVQEWVSGMKEIVEENGRERDMDNYSAIGIWCR